jgi:hypothetical protein
MTSPTSISRLCFIQIQTILLQILQLQMAPFNLEMIQANEKFYSHKKSTIIKLNYIKYSLQ